MEGCTGGGGNFEMNLHSIQQDDGLYVKWGRKKRKGAQGRAIGREMRENGSLAKKMVEGVRGGRKIGWGKECKGGRRVVG